MKLKKRKLLKYLKLLNYNWIQIKKREIGSFEFCNFYWFLKLIKVANNKFLFNYLSDWVSFF